MKYFYSISTQGFYLDNIMLDAYKAAGSLPADLQEISEADYLAFFNPPDGFAGIFDEKGPRIERLPELDPVAIAENQRRLLLSEIAPTISVWQTKIRWISPCQIFSGLKNPPQPPEQDIALH
ncbi:MAG: hypothetical protein KH310_17630 [Enterobacteriaceae bacterium]|nr:hypothetical protein [Enterobacteriaceae bacterium]